MGPQETGGCSGGVAPPSGGGSELHGCDPAQRLPCRAPQAPPQEASLTAFPLHQGQVTSAPRVSDGAAAVSQAEAAGLHPAWHVSQPSSRRREVGPTQSRLCRPDLPAAAPPPTSLPHQFRHLSKTRGTSTCKAVQQPRGTLRGSPSGSTRPVVSQSRPGPHPLSSGLTSGREHCGRAGRPGCSRAHGPSNTLGPRPSLPQPPPL